MAIQAEVANALAAQKAIMAHIDNVTELRFGSNIKLVKMTKRSAHSTSPTGWLLFVEGVMGGHAMNFNDGFLYRANRPDHNVFSDMNFYNNDIAEVIRIATELEANLAGRNVVDPCVGFISKFLNPKTFGAQSAYWASEGAVELKSR